MKKISTESNNLSKRYYTIGEVSDLCAVKSHVLRYWEQEFPQLNPLKRKGNRRYYQQKDIILVQRIKELLYEQGFTISGARTQLSLPLLSEKLNDFCNPDTSLPSQEIVGELKLIAELLKA
ncbi:MAG: MerR family transcriptional regulator [Legionellales bacterium]|nr:MerR family transcriptional regulator [Legionellales bacterium]